MGRRLVGCLGWRQRLLCEEGLNAAELIVAAGGADADRPEGRAIAATDETLSGLAVRMWAPAGV